MKAIVLLSGGLDSTVMLAIALKAGRSCHALSFDYGQRHRIELEAANAITKHYGITHQIITIDPTTFGHAKEPHKNRSLHAIATSGLPNSYVPARNTLFLSYALGQAEMRQAEEIYFGPNALDSAYPDCRPAFVDAFQGVINLGIGGKPPRLITPLLSWDKVRIVQEGRALDAPIHLTWSCYDPMGKVPCGACDACILRKSAESAIL